MNRYHSYLIGLFTAGLIVAPNVPFRIPLMVNSFLWVSLVVFSALISLTILHSRIHFSLRILLVYLFINCFLSQSPYLSFNAFILSNLAVLFYILAARSDFSVILKILESAFFLEVIFVIFQLFGMDVLLNFGAKIIPSGNSFSVVGLEEMHKPVFFGTVMQYMRFASLLAVLSPFLIIKNKLYIVPILILCAVSRSSSFFLSLLAGVLTYFLFTGKRRILIMALSAISFCVYAAWDWGSFRGAIIPENGGRILSWAYIFKTWFTDTSSSQFVDIFRISGPFNFQWFLFGHGMDTFETLFKVYKRDFNPFPQAHNCWLQFPWEIGLIGLALILIYVSNLAIRLYERKAYLLISGIVCISVNMFFAFPTRMTQTMFLIVLYAALCESYLSGSFRIFSNKLSARF